MAAPANAVNIGSRGSVAVPVVLADGSTAYASLIVNVQADGTVLPVASPGATLATNQVSVTTSSTLVVAARAGRQSVTISSTTAVVYYLGANGVTAANGLYVAAAAGASITLNTAAAVYAVGASAVTLSYLENY